MPLRTDCWLCGQPGVPVGGHAWLRRCVPCDFEWNSQPPGSADERTQEQQRGRRLDKIAARYGLGNRDGFLEHVPGELSSPA